MMNRQLLNFSPPGQVVQMLVPPSQRKLNHSLFSSEPSKSFQSWLFHLPPFLLLEIVTLLLLLLRSESDGDIYVITFIWLVDMFSVRKACIYVLQCVKADSPTSLQGLSGPDVSAAVSINK